MIRFSYLVKSIRAFRAGSIGDAAAYKAAAGGLQAQPELARRLAALDTPFPVIDLICLRTLAPRTFGRAYVDFIDRHGFTPLAPSAPVAAELADGDILAVRYTLLHDAFHVLLGFDAGLPGELGVWTFVAAQRYTPAFGFAAACAALLYPLLAPRSWTQLRHARRAAAEIARRADCVLAAPLDQYWACDLAEVRAQLGIVPYRPPQTGTFRPCHGNS